MVLGKKADNSRIDILIFQNMHIQTYERRSYVAEIDFSNVLGMMNEYNRGRKGAEKLRLPAVLMRAVALAYDYTDEQGNQPYRRLSGVLSFLPWGGSWESETIDVSLMIVRELDGNKQQTCAYTFKEVNKINTLELSRQIWNISTCPEDEVDQFRALKRIAHLPAPLTYLLLHLTKIPWIRAQTMAPTSVSILPVDIKWGQGEHTSMFGLAGIDKKTNIGMLQWTFDHRLGMGMHFGKFLEHIKHTLDSGAFLQQDIQDDGAA